MMNMREEKRAHISFEFLMRKKLFRKKFDTNFQKLCLSPEKYFCVCENDLFETFRMMYRCGVMLIDF